MRHLLYLLLIAAAPLQGQVSLVIENPDQRGFYLGVNHYLQHPEKQKEVTVNGLDTIPYLLHVETDSFNFRKTIHLRAAGTYLFRLQKNSRGELQLRYRGSSNGRSSSPQLSYHQAVPWPASWQPKLPASTLAQRRSLQIKEEKSQPRHDSLFVTIETPDSLGTAARVLNPLNDTIKNQEVAVVQADVAEAKPYPHLLAQMSAEDFEFERLKLALAYLDQNTLLTEEVAELMRLFRYDHSRLEFIAAALPVIRDPQNIAGLEKEFEYILSKQKFKQLLTNAEG